MQPEGVEYQKTEARRPKITSYSQEACFKGDKDVRSSRTTGEARRPVKTDNDRWRKLTKDGEGELKRTPNAARLSQEKTQDRRGTKSTKGEVKKPSTTENGERKSREDNENR